MTGWLQYEVESYNKYYEHIKQSILRPVLIGIVHKLRKANLHCCGPHSLLPEQRTINAFGDLPHPPSHYVMRPK